MTELLKPLPQEDIEIDIPVHYNRHYITTDSQGRITGGWSNGPLLDRDTTDAVCVNEEASYQFRLAPVGEENSPLYTMDGIPLYRWYGEQIVPRTEEEIAADRAAVPKPPPSEKEDLAGLLVDHEYRLTLLELGVGEEV